MKNQKTQLDRYVEEYFELPDFDVRNEVNQRFFYQEGGFARFVPIAPAPVGFPSPNVPQAQMPRDDSMQSLQYLGASLQNLGQMRMQNRALNMRERQFEQEMEFNKERHQWDVANQQANLQLRQQEFEQRAKQFEVTSMLQKLQMNNTFTDSLMKQEIPLYRMDDYKALLDENKVAMYQEEAMSTDDPQAFYRFATATSKTLSDPRLIEMRMQKSSDDEIIKRLSLMPPDMFDYSNGAEILAASIAGKPLPPIDIDPAYETYIKAKNSGELQHRLALTNELNSRAQEHAADAIYNQMRAQMGKELYDGMVAELEGVTDHDARFKIMEKWNLKAGKPGSGSSGVPNNEYAQNWLRADMISKATGRPFHEVYEEILRSTDSADPKNYDEFTGQLLKTVGSSFGTMVSIIDNTNVIKPLANKINGSTYYDNISFNPLDSPPEGGNGLSLFDKDKKRRDIQFTPTGIQVHGGDSAGSVMLMGDVQTTSRIIATKLGGKNYTFDGKKGTYTIKNVKTSNIDYDKLGITLDPSFLRGGSPGPKASDGFSFDYKNSEMPENVRLKEGLNASNFSPRSKNTMAQAPTSLMISDDHVYHEGDIERGYSNADYFDVGLGASREFNQDFYEFVTNDEHGLEYLIKNGYEVHEESNEKDHTPGLYYHAAMVTTKNPKATAPHLHFQNYGATPEGQPRGRAGSMFGIPVRVWYEPSTKDYRISYPGTSREPTRVSWEWFYSQIKAGGFNPK